MPLSLDTQLAWWLSPLSGSMTHEIDSRIMWHARLMVFAWAFLLPLGVVAARFYKVTPHQNWPQVLDSRAWWNAHRALQYSGVVVMSIGVWLSCGVGAGASLAAKLHGWLGWSVVAIGLFQVVSAWLRGSKGGPTEPTLRGDHYDMTPHRIWFERLHKGGGWLALLLAIVTIGLGLVESDAPRWMVLTLVLWWVFLIGWATHAHRTGRGINTYQAIWGPDARHPGNL